MSLISDVAFTDQDGVGVPLITRRQSSLLAAAMLQEAAAETVGENIDAGLRSNIARLALGRLVDRAEALEALAKTKIVRESSGPTELAASDFVELASTFATHLPIFCLVSDCLLQRSIITLTYTDPLEIDETSFRKGRVRRSVGWKSEHLSVGISEVGASDSHHIEVVVPDDLQVNYVSLNAKKYSLSELPWRKVPRQLRDLEIRQVGPFQSGNLYIPRREFVRRSGRVAIKMRTHNTRFLSGAFFVSLFTTLTLWALAEVAPSILKSSEADPQVAGLLILPTIVAAYIVRPGEHVLTARMLRAARYFLVANTMLAVVGALVFATTPTHGSSPGVDLGGFVSNLLSCFASQDSPANGLAARWGFLAILSAFFTVGFLISNILPRPHGKTRYEPMPISFTRADRSHSRISDWGEWPG
jgi:hypothetical protein